MARLPLLAGKQLPELGFRSSQSPAFWQCMGQDQLFLRPELPLEKEPYELVRWGRARLHACKPPAEHTGLSSGKHSPGGEI